MEKSMGRVRDKGSCGVCGDDMPASGGYGIMHAPLCLGNSFVVLELSDINRGAAFDSTACGIRCASAFFQMRLQERQGIRPALHMAAEPRDVECPICGSLMPEDEGEVCLDCQGGSAVSQRRPECLSKP